MDAIRRKLGLGTTHHQAGRLDQAEQVYRAILDEHPNQPDAIHLLGLLSRQRGDLTSATVLIRRAIALNAHVPAYHNNLGATCLDLGDFEAAEAAFAAALALDPRHAQALYNLAFSQQQQSAFNKAIATYRRVLTLAPSAAHAWTNLGNCQFATGDPKAALDSYARASALDRRSVEPVNNAAAVHLATGHAEQAEGIYRQVLRDHPSFAEAHHNLGLALVDLERSLEAIACFRAALRLKPDYAEAHYGLGNMLCDVGDYAAATEHYGQALALRPAYAASRLALMMAAAPSLAGTVAESRAIPLQFAAAVDDLQEWCQVNPGALASAIGSAQPFALAYRPEDVTRELAAYGDLICAEARVGGGPIKERAPAIGGKARVRLGIVSGHVRRHPVWQIILKGMLTTIDRDRFDLRLYNTTRRTDAQTIWAAGHVAHYRPQPLTAARWTEHIVADAPDLLYFPEIGMDPITGFVAAHRLAPLQLASWGHPITTGLPSIDLFLSGALLEPDGAAAHYSEQLICLPGTGVMTCFDPLTAQPWRGPARNGAVRFALCQQAMKFDPAYDRLIARVIAEAGDAELWVVHSVKHPWTGEALAARLSRALAQEGLDPDRHLRLTPWMHEQEFYGFLSSMDVILDCPAFSGYTTAWQALNCGVPIVTLDGQFLRQRLAAGLMRQAGVTDGIACDTDDYIARAITLAERSRTPDGRAALSRLFRAAAPRADGNRAAITAMEQAFLS